MNKWHFAIGLRDEAEMLVRRYHYSGTNGSAIAVVGSLHGPGGLFGDLGEMVAACFFGWPPARWSEQVLELVRLVRHPIGQVALSGLVGKTCDYIRRHRVCDLLVSYADAAQCHHGGIYQACSWHYAGQRPPRIDGVFVNGTYIAGRQANNMWGTQSPAKLSSMGIGDVVGRIDQGKHLYWRALNRDGNKKAARLGLRSLPYPKPDAAKTIASFCPNRRDVERECVT